ncbi:DUF6640 family protein [Planococcus halotolerans]|uniref:Acetyltransferase n=1 Tax=Planococcus halotolerans TaxID=2233542 RepID=A0A365KUC6_9BACL|nr:DUF6640 family protein [Planococcus halotolerans]RAZ76776.1 hypothetical protein DP120_12155 [Planococcus halotolerans]
MPDKKLQLRTEHRKARPAPVQQKQIIPTGKLLLVTVAGLTTVGGFIADWNKTHLFNPNWPPHAKFHDAMSITIATFLGGAGMYLLLRKGEYLQRDTQMAAMLPAFFWASQGISFAFPGAKGLESEFPELVPRIKGVWLNEKFVAIAMLSLTGIGYTLERQRQND